MPELLLPLFPLSLVLLPGNSLPLHIFEERYKEMMSDVIPSHAEFGIVLARDGGLLNVGCTATVEQVLQRYPDGRLDVMALGRRRFRIASLDDEKSYLRAAVEFFNDEEASEVPADLRARAIAAYLQFREGEEHPPAAAPRLDDPHLSFQLAGIVDDLEHRQALLALRSEAERLNLFVRFLPGYLARRERITLAQRVAPRNGHAKDLAGEH